MSGAPIRLTSTPHSGPGTGQVMSGAPDSHEVTI
jgi:hypothetical protein